MMAQRLRGILRGGSLALLLASIAWMRAPATTARAAATILYVKWDASGANNGTSWTNAYASLQTALDAAASGGFEIWVAAGTYRPFRTFPPDPSDTFQLHNNVALYGGFAGTETQRSQRNWQTNVTTLNGYWFILGNPHHAYHVVTGSGTNATAVLDGFTVTGGDAKGTGNDTNGGGMLNITGSPTVSNVTFSGNSATLGGGMFNDNSSPTLTNITFNSNSATNAGGGMDNYNNSNPTLTVVIFSGNSATSFGGGMGNYTGSNPTLTIVAFIGNSAQSGGGIVNRGSSPTLSYVTFAGNSATNRGGGMYNSNVSNPTLTDVTFNGNSALGGGGMYNETSEPDLINVIFSGNAATNTGGGVQNSNSNNPTLTNVTFSGNSATNNGGGIYNDASNPSIVNSILWGNTAPVGAQVYDFNSSSPLATYNDIQGGYAGTGNINSAPKFIRDPSPGADGLWGTADDDYGDLHLGTGSPAIDAGSNSAVPGGITRDREGNPRIMGIKVDMGAYEAFPVRIFLPLVRK